MRPIGLYVHWPFCARICPYCDFTVARMRTIDDAAWERALLDDLARMADLAEPRPLASVYFGGGTPSLVPPRIAERVFERAEELFGFVPGAEFTVEANPDDRARFGDLRAAGFRRLSLGVQSFNDEALSFLGRIHDGAEARAAVEAALLGFDRVSLDFIYALPDQDEAMWTEELEAAMASGVGHLSLYQLTIEPRTAFGAAARRGTLRPMQDDRAAAFYELTASLTEAGGMPAYEVSNHARPGEEAVHNALYWQDADWIAIGPGAHGRIGPDTDRLATEGVSIVSRYPQLEPAERLTVEGLSLGEHRLEALAGGLRPVAGLDLSRLGEEGDAVLLAARPFIEEGLMTHGEGRLAATARGRLLLDYLAAELSGALSAS